MLEARFRPLAKWPGKLGGRNGQFRTNYNSTLDKLEYELARIKARDILIEAGYTLQDLRNDGWPRAGLKPRHPGVILYCVTPQGPLRFACGTFYSMEQNMHAIALTLEALRAVDRYGATEEHQQYIGFGALPPAATEEAVKGWTLDEAALWLASRTPWAPTAADLLNNREQYRKAYRDAARRLHPDAGGSNEQFGALQAVDRLFEQHFEERSATS